MPFNGCCLEMKELYTGGKAVEEAFPAGHWVPTAVTWVPSGFFQALLSCGVRGVLWSSLRRISLSC